MESSEDQSSLLSEPIDDVTPTQFDETCTIIYADEIPVDDECLEIHSETHDSPEDIYATFKDELMDGLISPIPSHLENPLNAISDCGYESHGSPNSLQDFSFREQQDDISYLLNDLFPSLAH